MKRWLTVFVLLCAALCGCGGGGGGSALPQAGPTSLPSAGLQNVTVSITIPAAASAGSAAMRSPRYVSINTQSASIAVNGGTPVIANLAAGSPNCTLISGGGRTCTVALSAPVGSDTFTEITYASATGTGAPLSQSKTAATIVAGKANAVSITLDGIVASIALTLANTSPTEGTPATIPLTVNFNDASGAAIIGSDPFVNPITLTNSDGSGATTLSKTTLNSPADAAGLTVAYTGAVIAQAVFAASSTGVPAAAITGATLTPQASAKAAFVDWPTYGYDAQRSGFNPNTTAITPASIAQLHIAWQKAIGGTAQSQPIVVTNVAGHQALLIIADFASEQAYDALTGQLVWSTTLPTQNVQGCGTSGISGTAAYDKALGAIFVAAGNGGAAPNHAVMYRLNVATGAITGSVDITPSLEPGEANFSHSGVTFANGRVYVGTGSDCEGSATQTYVNWRGRVVSVDPGSMTLSSTFYTTWQVGSNPGNYGGGGVWSWGGVSSDTLGNVYVATGNAETNAATTPLTATAPFTATDDEQAGLAEHLVQLSGDLSTVESSNYPGFNFTIGYGDLDYSGTPVIYQPPATSGCGTLSATQGKGGLLVINNTQTLKEVSSFALSVPSGRQYYSGNPAYSPTTGLLYAPITSAGNGSSTLPPGLAAIGSCGTSIVWNAQFGQDAAAFQGDDPRSAPTVTAGGVVFLGTPCTPNGSGGCGAPGVPGGALWAVDATTGSVLGGGTPLLTTADSLRMAPSADGLWLFLLDDSGNLYALTVDPTVPAVKANAGRRVMPTYRYHEN